MSNTTVEPKPWRSYFSVSTHVAFYEGTIVVWWNWVRILGLLLLGVATGGVARETHHDPLGWLDFVSALPGGESLTAQDLLILYWPAVLLGAVAAYALLALLLNRTYLIAGPDGIRKAIGPLPWPGGRRVAAQDLDPTEPLSVTRVLRTSRENGKTKTSTSFELRTRVKQGPERLLHSFAQADDAQNAKGAIESFRQRPPGPGTVADPYAYGIKRSRFGLGATPGSSRVEVPHWIAPIVVCAATWAGSVLLTAADDVDSRAMAAQVRAEQPYVAPPPARALAVVEVRPAHDGIAKGVVTIREPGLLAAPAVKTTLANLETGFNSRELDRLLLPVWQAAAVEIGNAQEVKRHSSCFFASNGEPAAGTNVESIGVKPLLGEPPLSVALAYGMTDPKLEDNPLTGWILFMDDSPGAENLCDQLIAVYRKALPGSGPAAFALAGAVGSWRPATEAAYAAIHDALVNGNSEAVRAQLSPLLAALVESERGWPEWFAGRVRDFAPKLPRSYVVKAAVVQDAPKSPRVISLDLAASDRPDLEGRAELLWVGGRWTLVSLYWTDDEFPGPAPGS